MNYTKIQGRFIPERSMGSDLRGSGRKYTHLKALGKLTAKRDDILSKKVLMFF
jgi:hypothetical protein